jgi:hypothetical protein
VLRCSMLGREMSALTQCSVLNQKAGIVKIRTMRTVSCVVWLSIEPCLDSAGFFVSVSPGELSSLDSYSGPRPAIRG